MPIGVSVYTYSDLCPGRQQLADPVKQQLMDDRFIDEINGTGAHGAYRRRYIAGAGQYDGGDL
jgi:hypothetical protein